MRDDDPIEELDSSTGKLRLDQSPGALSATMGDLTVYCSIPDSHMNTRGSRMNANLHFVRIQLCWIATNPRGNSQENDRE